MLLGNSISNWGLKGGSSDDDLLFEGIDDWGVTYTLKTLNCDLNKEIKRGIGRKTIIHLGWTYLRQF
jgi:hypothetical protein